MRADADMHTRSITCCDLYVWINVRSYCMLADALQTDIPPSPLPFSQPLPGCRKGSLAGFVGSFEQPERPRQKQVQQENPILGKASPVLHRTLLYSRTAQNQGWDGCLQHSQSSAQSYHSVPVCFQGGPQPKRGPLIQSASWTQW